MVDKAIQALATVSASLVVPHDISGTLVGMLSGVRSALEVESAGILAADRAGRFEVLSASSHGLVDLALYECQALDGPAAEACMLNDHVSVAGIESVRGRWSPLASAMETAGYESVLASPLRWNEEPLGAVLAFRRGVQGFSSDERLILQAFADLSMLVVIHTDRRTVQTAARRMDEALESRVLIEQAKGVLAYTRQISMSEAYEALQELSREAGIALTAGAQHVISHATDRSE